MWPPPREIPAFLGQPGWRSCSGASSAGAVKGGRRPFVHSPARSLAVGALARSLRPIRLRSTSLQAGVAHAEIELLALGTQLSCLFYMRTRKPFAGAGARHPVGLEFALMIGLLRALRAALFVHIRRTTQAPPSRDRTKSAVKRNGCQLAPELPNADRLALLDLHELVRQASRRAFARH